MRFNLDPEGCRKLREARKFKDIKQWELAKLLAIARSTYSRIEAGERKLSTEQSITLEDKLDLKPGSLSPKTIPANSIQTQEQNNRTLGDLLQRQTQKIQAIEELLRMLIVNAKHTTDRLNDIEETLEQQHLSEEQPKLIYTSNRLSYTTEELVEKLSSNEKLLRTDSVQQKLNELNWHSAIEKGTRTPLISLSDVQRVKVLTNRFDRPKLKAGRFPATPEQ